MNFPHKRRTEGERRIFSTHPNRYRCDFPSWCASTQVFPFLVKQNSNAKEGSFLRPLLREKELVAKEKYFNLQTSPAFPANLPQQFFPFIHRMSRNSNKVSAEPWVMRCIGKLSLTQLIHSISRGSYSFNVDFQSVVTRKWRCVTPQLSFSFLIVAWCVQQRMKIWVIIIQIQSGLADP